MATKEELISLEKLRTQRKPIVNTIHEYRNQLSTVERFAMWITEHIGSMRFFFFIVGGTFFWLLWNNLAPQALRFDPVPFVLWLFVSNMIQISIMPLIMVGQNLQSRYSETRAQSEFETNVKAEKEVEIILSHLEYQHELLERILAKLDKAE